jgi:hypothetical protein
LGTNTAAQLAEVDEKVQLDKLKSEYPSILNVTQDQAGDQDCERIRIDFFTDSKFTFMGIKELDLSHGDPYRMSFAIFSEYVRNFKKLYPL